MAKKLELRPVAARVEAALDAMLLPVLAIGLGLKGQMQLDIAERFVAHGQHPQSDLAFVAVGERSQGFGIQLAGTAEFSERQSVGHQVSAPQVVHPQTQVMFNSRAFSGVKLRSGQAGFQVMHGITNGCGQAVG